MHQLETASDNACTPEQRADLLGRGVGGDVEVGGLEPGDQVTYRAANNIGIVPMLVQDFTHLDGMPGHQTAINAVHIARQTLRAFVDGRGK